MRGFEPPTSASQTLRAKPAALHPATMRSIAKALCCGQPKCLSHLLALTHLCDLHIIRYYLKEETLENNQAPCPLFDLCERLGTKIDLCEKAGTPKYVRLDEAKHH